jgi:hypothetical protein
MGKMIGFGSRVVGVGVVGVDGAVLRARRLACLVRRIPTRIDEKWLLSHKRVHTYDDIIRLACSRVPLDSPVFRLVCNSPWNRLRV